MKLLAVRAHGHAGADLGELDRTEFEQVGAEEAARPTITGSALASGCPPAIAGAYGEVRRSLDALLTLGLHGESATLGELGFLGLLLSDSKDILGFFQSAIGPVLGYDARKGSELMRKLEAYFAGNGNLILADGMAGGRASTGNLCRHASGRAGAHHSGTAPRCRVSAPCRAFPARGGVRAARSIPRRSPVTLRWVTW